MGIKIHIDSLLSDYTNNQRTAEVKGDTVSECLQHLAEQFPELIPFTKDGKLLVYQDCYLGVFVNGEIVYPKEMDKPVKDGDELSVILMVGGG